MDKERLLKSMTNIKPNENQIERIETIRSKYKEVIEVIFNNIEVHSSENKEIKISITKLEESLMWIVKSIILEAEI